MGFGSQRFHPRHVSNSLTKPNRQYLALLGGYLSPMYSDNLRIASLELCCKAGCFEYNCHNPTNNPKQLKTTFVGVVLLSVRKPHHHTTTTTLGPFTMIVCNLILTQLDGIWKTTKINFLNKR
jgi:hypothetical protein